MPPQTPVDERITLHVLRHSPSNAKAAEEVLKVVGPNGALRAVLQRADQEHQSVLREVSVVFYYGNATPSVLEIDRDTADDLRASLGLQETVFGVWGPGTIRFGGALYEVWIQHQLCG